MSGNTDLQCYCGYSDHTLPLWIHVACVRSFMFGSKLSPLQYLRGKSITDLAQLVLIKLPETLSMTLCDITSLLGWNIQLCSLVEITRTVFLVSYKELVKFPLNKLNSLNSLTLSILTYLSNLQLPPFHTLPHKVHYLKRHVPRAKIP